MSDSEADRPQKRARHSPPPSARANGNGHPPDRALPPLSLSILGVEPLDEFIREVADWIQHVVLSRQEREGTVEIEAKIGILRDSSGQRFSLPVLTETILVPQMKGFQFESNMSPMQHKHFNQLLNNLKMTSSQPNYPSSPLGYTHLHLIDTFYGPDHDRIRVTRDEKTGTVTACVRKIRLGSLNIYSPKRAADWRISVNVEVNVPPPIGTAAMTRKKDRMSYTHEEFIIDLTQVTSSSGPGTKPEVSHELEVEIARPEYLLASMAKRGDPGVSEQERYAYDELIRAFVNNARVLVRNAGDWS